MKDHVKLKAALAVASFVAAVLFGVAAFICPPLAIIDASILWFIALLLCFTATLLGFSMSIDNMKQIVKSNNETK